MNFFNLPSVRAIIPWPIREAFSIWMENFSKVWAFLRNFFSKHHVAAMFALTWLTIRFAVFAVGELFTRVVLALTLAKTSVSSASSMASGSGLVGVFDLVNSVFPLWELLILCSALLSVKGAFLIVNAIRYLYKNVPLKAT